MLVRPGASREEDAELYAQRANTVVTLAAYAVPTADLARERADALRGGDQEDEDRPRAARQQPRLKVALHAESLETEGAFSLGLGLRAAKLSHKLAASAWATLCLVRPLPLARAELEAKAKGPTAPTKKAPPPKT